MASEFEPQIANEKLTLSTVPTSDSNVGTIFSFALTFDGYEYWGSFEKCADVANTKSHRTLTELRTCLFFEQRRHHHWGVAPNRRQEKYLRGLIIKIRDKVARGEME